MADHVRERSQYRRKDFINEVPADGKGALAQGAVGNADAGDGFHVGGEVTGSGKFMINSGHDPLPRGEFGSAATARAVAGKNALATGFAQQSRESLGKVAEKGMKGRGCVRHPPNQTICFNSTSAECAVRIISESLKALG